MKSITQFIKESLKSPEDFIRYFMGSEDELKNIANENSIDKKLVDTVNDTIKKFIKDNGIKNISDIKAESTTPEYWDGRYKVTKGNFDPIEDEQTYSIPNHYSFSYNDGQIIISSETGSSQHRDFFDVILSKK